MYRLPSFVQMPFVADEEDKATLDFVECQLKYKQQVKRQPRASAQVVQQTQLEWVEHTISIHDLFTPRSVQHDQGMVPVDKVLLVGEAGVGKSTVARKLASDWALGKWGKRISCLFLAAVCNLQEGRFTGECASYISESLGTALALECFASVQGESQFRWVRSVVELTLSEPSTLVVLDGLDESASSSEYILREANHGKHELLLTSRPYGVKSEERLVDLIVEHQGLSLQQMRSFSSLLLQGKGAPRGVCDQFQAVLNKVEHLQELACVPINLRILLQMWQQDPGRLVQAGNSSLADLYATLTGQLVDRLQFSEPSSSRSNWSEVQASLETIALKMQQAGEVRMTQVILQSTVRTKARSLAASVLLRKDGFWCHFPHLTFQEYYAGRALARQFDAGVCQDDREELQATLQYLKHQPQHQRTIDFMIEETLRLSASSEQDTVLTQLLDSLMSQPEEAVSMQELALLIRCVHEWFCLADQVDDAAVVSTIAKVEGRFKLGSLFCSMLRRYIEMYQLRMASSMLQPLDHLILAARRGSRWASQHHVMIVEVARSMLDERHLRYPASHALAQLGMICTELGREVLRVLSEQIKRGGTQDSYFALLDVVTLAQTYPCLAGDALPLLIQTLKDQVWRVSEAAAKGLFTLAQTSPGLAGDAFTLLMEALKDEDWRVLEAAAKGLVALAQACRGQFGDANPTLIQALKGGEWTVCSAAVKGLLTLAQAYPGLAGDAMPYLTQALQDQDVDVREASLEGTVTLAQASPGLAGDAMPSLQQALKDKDRNVRRRAAEGSVALAQAFPGLARDSIPSLMQTVKDEDQRVSQAAANGLVTLVQNSPGQFSNAIPTLTSGLEGEHWTASSVAEKCLVTIGQKSPGWAEKVMTAVIQFLKSGRGDLGHYGAVQVLIKLAQAFPGIAGDAMPSLQQTLKDKDRNVRRLAAEGIVTLALVYPERRGFALPALIQLLKVSSTFRSKAIKALVTQAQASQDHAGDVIPSLIWALKDKNWRIRQDAAKGLVTLAQSSPDLTEDAMCSLKMVLIDEYVDVRKTALEGISSLIEILKTQGWRFRHARKDAAQGSAALAQASFGLACDAMPLLLQALKDEDQGVRQVAANGLVTLVQNSPDQLSTAIPTLISVLEFEDCTASNVVAKAIVTLGHKSPGLAEEATTVVIQVLKRGRGRVGRYNAVKVLIQLAQAYPGIAEDAMPLLQQALKYRYSSACCLAAEGIVTLALVYPDRRGIALPALIQLLKGSCTFRSTAIKALVTQAQSSQDRAGDAIPSLRQALMDKIWRVRQDAAKGLVTLALSSPGLAGDAMSSLMLVLKDEYIDVCKTASEGISSLIEILKTEGRRFRQASKIAAQGSAALAQASPGVAGDAMPLLLQAPKYEDRSVHVGAAKGLLALAPASHGQLANAMFTLILAVNDEDVDMHVREISLENVISLAQVSPDLAGDAMPSLIQSLEQGWFISKYYKVVDKSVRSTAVRSCRGQVDPSLLKALKQLGWRPSKICKVAAEGIATLAKAYPGLAGDAMPSLAKALKGEDVDVCEAASVGIVTLAQVSPGLAGDAMSSLQSAIKHQDRRVGKVAAEGMCTLARAYPGRVCARCTVRPDQAPQR